MWRKKISDRKCFFWRVMEFRTNGRIRAERRMGELLAVMEKAKGGQPYQPTPSKKEGVEKLPATLSDLGIDYKLSVRLPAFFHFEDWFLFIPNSLILEGLKRSPPMTFFGLPGGLMRRPISTS